MDLTWSDAEEHFRAEARSWLDSLKVTLPQRTLTSASGLSSSISVSPTSRLIIRLSGSLPS